MKKTILFFLFSLSFFLFHGCSMIGLGIGSVLDNKKPDFISHSFPDMKDIPVGEQIQLKTVKGDSYFGYYLGIEPFDKDTSAKIDSAGRNFRLGIAGAFGKKFFSSEDIEEILTFPEKNERLKGFLIGLGIDVIIAVAIISSWELPIQFNLKLY